MKQAYIYSAAERRTHEGHTEVIVSVRRQSSRLVDYPGCSQTTSSSALCPVYTHTVFFLSYT